MKLVIKPSLENPNTRENADISFAFGGIWDQNGGRKQTRKFADCFHRNIRVPFKGSFSVLDAGCALGDALPVWKKKYPQAKLYGCDISKVAIDRCLQSYGDIAQFFCAGLDEIDGYYDVIYCSNVLEHFDQYFDIAEELSQHCRWLYILTPYLELRDNKPLKPTLGSFHVVTFSKDAFEGLERIGQVRITTQIVSCPGAWGPEGWRLVESRLKFWITGRPWSYRQIIYCMENIREHDYGVRR